jgi:ABC-type multidrug transport system fused ATPase/permease subunit
MTGWDELWGLLWWFFWVFAFVAYLMALFSVIADLFRDHKLNGWAKALWILFLIFVPFITVLIYLIARGGTMAERSQRSAQAANDAANSYIRQVAGSPASPSEEISKASALLASGSITQAEFDRLKSHALSQVGV